MLCVAFGIAIVLCLCLKCGRAGAEEPAPSQVFLADDLFNRLPVPLLLFDARAEEIVSANSAFQALHGGPFLPGGFPLSAALFFDSPDLTSCLLHQAGQLAEGGSPEGEVFLLRRAGGLSIPVTLILQRKVGDRLLLSLEAQAGGVDAGMALFGQAVREALPGILYLVDGSGRFLAGNLSFERLAGLSSATMRGRPLAEILPGPAAEALTGGGDIRESRIRSTSRGILGSSPEKARHYEIIRVPLFDPQGAYMGFMGHARDCEGYIRLDELSKHQNDLLAASGQIVLGLLTEGAAFEKRLWRALSHLGQAEDADRVYVWRNIEDDDGILRAVQIAEWAERAPSLAELGGKLEIVYDEDAPLLRTCLEAGEYLSGPARGLSLEEQAMMRQKGALSVLIAPIRLRDSLWGFIGLDDCRKERVWTEADESILSITGSLVGSMYNLLHTHEVLRASDARLQDVAFASGEVIWELDSQGLITYISPRCRDVIGREPGALLGRHAVEIAGTEPQLLFFHDHIHRQLDFVGFFRDVEHPVTDSSGNTRMLRSSGVPLYAGDTYVGLRVASRDVTQEKENENRLKDALAQVRSANEELQQYAAVNQELAAKANAASQTKSDFLANIGHEVRTPINVITGMAYLAMRAPLAPAQQEQLGRIRAAGEALLEIMNNILEFAKLETDRSSLGRHPLRFPDVLRAALSSFEGAAAAKGLKMSMTVAPEVPAVLRGDPARLGQIFKNLVGNAVKFTEKGDVTVECRLESEDGEGAVLLCLVRDTGIGMSEEQVRGAFESFTQGDGSSTRRIGGTGVGLSLIRKLVEAMDGKIWIESRPGEGTSVFFTVRLGRDAAPAEEAAHCPEDAAGPLPVVAGKAVLLFTDETMSGQTTADAIRGMGAAATFVTGIPETLALIDAASGSPPFDLLVVALPDNGKDVCRALAAQVRRRAVCDAMPILAQGGCCQTDNQSVCADHGIDACLRVGIPMSTLQRCIATWLARGRNGGAGASQTESGSRRPEASGVAASGAQTPEPEVFGARESLSQHGETLLALENLLADDDAESLAVFERLQPLLKREVPELAAGLSAALAAFDFPEALALLRGWREKMSA